MSEIYKSLPNMAHIEEKKILRVYVPVPDLFDRIFNALCE